MANFTRQISFTGGTYSNLLTRMRALGYKGSGIVSSLAIGNADAALLLLIFLTDDGINTPPTQTPALATTDGWPVGAGAGGLGPAYFSDRGANVSSLDLAGTWIYAASTVAANVMAVGA